MGVRNRRREQRERLRYKCLDEEFKRRICEGLNCSPFEAAAVTEAVHEVYGAYLGEPAQALPGQIAVVAVDADEPAGKPLAVCAKRTVCVRVHRGPEDDALVQDGGWTAWRRARLPEVCQEALSQGGLLTREDLACRVFFVSPRTISRDLAWLRERAPDAPLPLRSAVHDIGPVLTHRVQIVRLALEGLTTTEIAQRMHHSPQAVVNYLNTFTRSIQLEREGLKVVQIAYLLRRGRALVEEYLALAREAHHDANRAYHLKRLLALGRGGGKKRRPRRGGMRHDA